MTRPIPLRYGPRSLVRRVVVALLLLALAGCATTPSSHDPDAPPPPRAQPAARIALRPEYRVFYDALQDYGDWTLIEPYGFVFRPRVDPLNWRPFEYGFWAPTDQFGWVWISAEPFGWATYHYGRWLYDDYQGWVWVPGLDWGPAWVAWQMGDQVVGWAPLPPSRSSDWGGGIPGGPYRYAPIGQFGATDVQTHAVTREQLGGGEAQSLRVVNGAAEVGGVRVPLGPPMERVERARGMTLTRVRLEDAVPQSVLAHGHADGTSTGGTTGSRDTGASGTGPGSGVESLRRAATSAAREAGTYTARPTFAPAQVPVVRPFGVPGMTTATPPPARPPAHGKASADSTKR